MKKHIMKSYEPRRLYSIEYVLKSNDFTESVLLSLLHSPGALNYEVDPVTYKIVFRGSELNKFFSKTGK